MNTVCLASCACSDSRKTRKICKLCFLEVQEEVSKRVDKITSPFPFLK